ncbi:MAG: tryptophan synthase subunit alpha [bacterium]
MMMTNGISSCLAQSGRRKLLIPFFTAGYPNMATTLEMVRVAADSGADMVELGFPFSDPLADGPLIQMSSWEAIQGGTTLASVLKVVAALRRFSDISIILMGYYNPVIAMGLEAFAKRAAGAGVDGLILPDVPVDESNSVRIAANRHNLSLIYLVAPTTTRPRLTQIDLASTEFVYAVTVTGVTGTGQRFSGETDRYLRQIRRTLSKPFVAGFGVSGPDDAVRLCRHADGVVIGSALVRLMATTRNLRDCRQQVGKFLSSLRRAL